MMADYGQFKFRRLYVYFIKTLGMTIFIEFPLYTASISHTANE